MKTINNNIKEKWVSFDNAKLLHNKGLELGSRQAYDLLENLSTPYYSDIYFNGVSNGDCSFEAPTQQLAIDWIRINFGIHIYTYGIKPYQDDEIPYPIIVWVSKICNNQSQFEKFVNTDNDLAINHFHTPEEAKEAAITYVLTTMI